MSRTLLKTVSCSALLDSSEEKRTGSANHSVSKDDPEPNTIVRLKMIAAFVFKTNGILVAQFVDF
jgi:hypothetical protein